MLLGQFEHAWEQTDKIESRRRKGLAVEGQLVWDGSDFRGKTVLLRNDHGLGDTVQFIRYAPLLKKQCRRLIAKARPILVPLLQRFDCIDDVIATPDSDPSFDVEMECTELPYIFRTTIESIPRETPYLKITNPAEQDPTTNIGLVWSSGPWNTARSVPLAQMRPLGRIPNVSFYSLQWGPDWIEAQYVEHGLQIRNASTAIREDLITTAQAILKCDLILTVDTMVAHLAGALGKPVWVLLHFNSDWRWMLDRQDSPWYPTMRLFRQRSANDWSTAIENVAEELGTFFK
jgi:hypothetical protein